jgi:hypothetical protein
MFQAHVWSVSSDVCCKCFIWMLQSRSVVAYVAIAIHTCFKCLICFKYILQVFYLNILKIDLREVHATTASVPSWFTMRACWCYCSVHVGVWNGASSGGPCTCVGPRGLRSGLGAGWGSCVRQVQVREHHLTLAPQTRHSVASISEKLKPYGMRSVADFLRSCPKIRWSFISK